MTIELYISVISLISAIIIGVYQIKANKKQKDLEIQMNKFETNISNISQISKGGITGNSNNGDINNNVF